MILAKYKGVKRVHELSPGHIQVIKLETVTFTGLERI